MPRSMRRWTPAEECYVIVNRRRLRIETLARMLGRTPKSVEQWCWRHRCFATRQSWYTTGEAARLTGLSPQRLTTLCRARRIRCRRVPGGRWWLIAPEAVEQMAQERRPEIWQRWRELAAISTRGKEAA